jgi:four helix bundle protein
LFAEVRRLAQKYGADAEVPAADAEVRQLSNESFAPQERCSCGFLDCTNNNGGDRGRSLFLQASCAFSRKRRDLDGRAFALGRGVPVSHVEDFAAYDFAVRFKLEVYRLIRESPGASKNMKYREQLADAVSGIEGAMSEGFGRGRPKEFALYLRYSLGSLNEAKTRLQDGIDWRLLPSGRVRAGVHVGRALPSHDTGFVAEPGTESG